MHLSHLTPALRDQALRLHRRYRRFFQVDLVIHALYALTAAFPFWAVIHLRREILFHSFGVISILAVSLLGILANRKLLKGATGGFALGLAATFLYLTTRTIILLWAMLGIFEMDVSYAFHHSDHLFILFFFIFCIYLFYRILYHISAYCHTRMFLLHQPRL